MFEIVKIRQLAPNVREYAVNAPAVVKNAQPGQFVILQIDEDGERVPFTICGIDKQRGTVTLLVQTIGYTTMKLAQMKEGDRLAAFCGPLGRPTKLEHFENIMLVGGGIGAAVIYPQAQYLKSQNKPADIIVGARTKELIMYEKELEAAAKQFFVTTDDGSYVRKGFVTEVLQDRLNAQKYDVVMAVGPMPMMRAVCAVTKQFDVHTIISMNSIMVDGTGMCGCCRLSVAGKTKYACVDGPEFDGHLVDWEEAILRSRIYIDIEKEHICRLSGKKG